MGLKSSAPVAGEIEVSVFGPGFGECSVIHVGDGHWAIIDSCIDFETGKPVALTYLDAIGADLNKVDLVLATHWHDDHVRGFAEIVHRCPNASVCLSSFITNEEFLTTVYANDERPMTSVSSGVREMRMVLDACKGRRVIRANADKRLLQNKNLSHNRDLEIWALSPGDKNYARFMLSLAKLFPQQGKQKSASLQ